MLNRKPLLGLRKTAPSQLLVSLLELQRLPEREWGTLEQLFQEEKVLQKKNSLPSRLLESLVQETQAN